MAKFAIAAGRRSHVILCRIVGAASRRDCKIRCDEPDYFLTG